MHKRILAICLATIFIAMAVIPTGFAGSTDQVVITYGETTYMNQQYKSIVDDYFAGRTNVDLNNVNLAEAAEKYLLNHGMTADAIETLKTKLR